MWNDTIRYDKPSVLWIGWRTSCAAGFRQEVCCQHYHIVSHSLDFKHSFYLILAFLILIRKLYHVWPTGMTHCRWKICPHSVGHFCRQFQIRTVIRNGLDENERIILRISCELWISFRKKTQRNIWRKTNKWSHKNGFRSFKFTFYKSIWMRE